LTLRIDPEQRFTCQSCGRCCRRWDVFVSAAEREAYGRRHVAQWFREPGAPAEGTDRDPFEPVPGYRGFFRIRTRDDGSCGFLSSDNRCRIHEELGAASKPLTCRMFPFTFHPAAGGAVVTASFGCPTIVANDGEAVSSEALEPLQKEAAGRLTDSAVGPQRQFVAGRPIDTRSIHIIRTSLLRILARADDGALDLGTNLQRIANLFDDLTRSRVLRLPDTDFAEYIKLTVPYAATSTKAPLPQRPGRIGRLMQFGFLFVVCATRYGIEHRTASPFAKRLAGVRLLAHFHGLAPGVDRVNVRAARGRRLDLDAPELQGVAYHYLRSSIEAIGARERPIVDDLAIAVSCLSAARRLAIMNAHAAGRRVNREIFSEALMESVDVLQADGSAAMRWALPRLAAGVEALRACARNAANAD
jgi:Fe-S-cluster containining protein